MTPPLGRQEVTGHLDEDINWTKGAHQLHFGGEIRKAQVNEFYLEGARGTINFDGTQGPWSAAAGSTPCTTMLANNGTPPFGATGAPTALYRSERHHLADFLAGCYDPAFTHHRGQPRRLVYVNSFAFYGQDTWKLTKSLSLNYGLRFDYEGPVHTGQPNLSIFDPSLPQRPRGHRTKCGQYLQQVLERCSPRVGFSYQAGFRR